MRKGGREEKRKEVDERTKGKKEGREGGRELEGKKGRKPNVYMLLNFNPS